MINLVEVFWGLDDQKCSLRALLRFVAWGSEKLILGVLTQIKFFFSKKRFKLFQNDSSKKKSYYFLWVDEINGLNYHLTLGLKFLR